MNLKEIIKSKGKYLLFGIIGLLLISGIIIYPTIKQYLNKSQERISDQTTLKSAKTPKEIYDMFQCSCCGKPIDANCCGMAKQRKEYADKLMLDDLEETELMLKMVKKFGTEVLMDPSKETEIKKYLQSQASKNPPKIEIENPKYNFGTIKQSEGVITTTFTIKNTGKKELIIENMDTSCMCTTAKIIYKGKESPQFGMSMHGNNPKNFELKILPGDSAELKVFYNPMAHGKQKKPELKITREVTIISNDPTNFQKKVRISLTQVP